MSESFSLPLPKYKHLHHILYKVFGDNCFPSFSVNSQIMLYCNIDRANFWFTCKLLSNLHVNWSELVQQHSQNPTFTCTCTLSPFSPYVKFTDLSKLTAASYEVSFSLLSWPVFPVFSPSLVWWPDWRPACGRLVCHHRRSPLPWFQFQLWVGLIPTWHVICWEKTKCNLKKMWSKPSFFQLKMVYTVVVVVVLQAVPGIQYNFISQGIWDPPLHGIHRNIK